MNSFVTMMSGLRKECILPSMFEICPVVREKKIFKIRQSNFCYFLMISPWKRDCPSFRQTWVPSPMDALSQVGLRLVQWFGRRRWKCKKFTNKRTDGRRAIRKARLSIQLLIKLYNLSISYLFKFIWFSTCRFTLTIDGTDVIAVQCCHGKSSSYISTS